MKRTTISVATIMISVASMFVVSPALASSNRVTHGDANAVLQAFDNAGWIIIHHSPTEVGAPADPVFQASIRPFSGSPWDGRHFCVLDWHVLLIADIEDTKARAEASSIDFTLDGMPIASDRTTGKRFLRDGAQPASWFVQDGAVLTPDALSVGTHTAGVSATFFDGFNFVDQITFYIDPAGVGTCL